MKAFLPSVSFSYPEGTVSRFKSGLLRWIEDHDADLLVGKGLGEIRDDAPAARDVALSTLVVFEDEQRLIGIRGPGFESPPFPRLNAMLAIQSWLSSEQGVYVPDDALTLLYARLVLKSALPTGPFNLTGTVVAHTENPEAIGALLNAVREPEATTEPEGDKPET